MNMEDSVQLGTRFPGIWGVIYGFPDTPARVDSTPEGLVERALAARMVVAAAKVMTAKLRNTAHTVGVGGRPEAGAMFTELGDILDTVIGGIEQWAHGDQGGGQVLIDCANTAAEFAKNGTDRVRDHAGLMNILGSTVRALTNMIGVPAFGEMAAQASLKEMVPLIGANEVRDAVMAEWANIKEEYQL